MAECLTAGQIYDSIVKPCGIEKAIAVAIRGSREALVSDLALPSRSPFRSRPLLRPVNWKAPLINHETSGDRVPARAGLLILRNSPSRSLSKWYSFATSIRFARKLQARVAANAPISGPTQ